LARRDAGGDGRAAAARDLVGEFHRLHRAGELHRKIDATAGGGTNPLLAAVGATTATQAAPQSLRDYGLGGTLKFSPDDRWTYVAVAGVDGYTLRNVANDFGYNPDVARNVIADVRYLLWLLDEVEKAPELVRELCGAPSREEG